MDNRRFIARRAAQYFNEGDTVNLGIGIPSACSDYVDPTIAFQTENGMIGVGPVAKKLAICDTYQLGKSWPRIRYGRCYGPLQRCKKSYRCHGADNKER